MEKTPQHNFKWGYSIFIVVMLGILGFIAVGILSLFAGVDVESLTGNVALIHIDGMIIGSEGSESFFEPFKKYKII